MIGAFFYKTSCSLDLFSFLFFKVFKCLFSHGESLSIPSKGSPPLLCFFPPPPTSFALPPSMPPIPPPQLPCMEKNGRKVNNSEEEEESLRGKNPTGDSPMI